MSLCRVPHILCSEFENSIKPDALQEPFILSFAAWLRQNYYTILISVICIKKVKKGLVLSIFTLQYKIQVPIKGGVVKLCM